MHAHAPGVPSDFPSQRDRFKKRPLFTQHLSKHCGFAFRLQWRGGYCGCLLKNKSVMRAEIDPRCRRSRRSGVGPDVNPASQILKFVSEFSSEFIFPLLMSGRGNYFWSKLKKSRVFFSIGPDSDIFIRKVLSCRLKCWRITLCMNVWRKNSFNKLYILKNKSQMRTFLPRTWH